MADIDGSTVGFVHVVINEDPHWGSLVDNLHVRDDCQGLGIGTGLLRRGASAIGSVDGRMYLWVLEENRRARVFYAVAGAQEVEMRPASPPALPGINKIRCVWHRVDVASDPVLH